ncbi:unnamed protein product [Cylicocyclus nassatus]|uniref:Cytochrome P450 n=1 Tax=Cylicocyclus nassatus TaxID=53992 RepID=A0AA36MES0_CYLNA|nr:unnamed protein product [Cylicocyclus nassatus]
MALAPILAAAFVIFFILYWKKMYLLIQERIRVIQCVDKIPGPYSIPVFGTTWQFKWNIAGLSIQMREWGNYYAGQGHGLIRFWLGTRPMIGCLTAETAKLVLERTDIITKGEEYNILMPWLGTGLLISTGEKWRARRKILTPSFHFKVLNDFIGVFDQQAKKFVCQLEDAAASKQHFDIFPYVKRCALDIICGRSNSKKKQVRPRIPALTQVNIIEAEKKRKVSFTAETAMGCHVSAQENHNHPYVFSVQRMSELAFLHERMPWMWIPAIWYASTYGLEYDRHLNIVTDFTRKVINERLSEREGKTPVDAGKRKAFLDLLLDVQAEGNLTYEDIREEVDTFMFEGHDTTASSMGWTLWFLAHNPHCLKKVQEELDEIFGDSDRSCTNDDLKMMKYTENCIKESLRLRPPVPFFTRKLENDIDIEGNVLPKGCSVMVTPFMVHSNPMIYKNPEIYDPERFSEENMLNRHSYAFIPFSAGPRNCIGQKFALLEEKTVLSWFFRRYSIRTDIAHEDNIPLPEIILRPSLGFPVVISRR